MPELPELEVLREVLGPRLDGQQIVGVTVSPKLSFLLRTPAVDFAQALVGRRFEGVWRRGKFLIFDVDGHRLVINPMLGGRLQWSGARDRVLPETVFRLTLANGQDVRFLDTVKMGRVYWVAAEALTSIPGWADLGPEAVDVDLESFRQRIRRHPGELKNLLRKQAFVAGIGNAYADEILHAAGFLPLRKRTSLKADDIVRLHGAVQDVLRGAIVAIRAQPHYELHQQDRTFLAVHGKGGQACPRCGHRISELTARGEKTDFCRGCQH